MSDAASDTPAVPQVTLPEWIWKTLQSVLAALMLMVLVWAWNLQSRINEFERLEADVIALEQKVEQIDVVTSDIKVIRVELSHIKEGIEDLKRSLKEK